MTANADKFDKVVNMNTNKKKILVLIGEKGASGEQFVSDLQHYSDDEYLLKRYADVGIGIQNGQVTVRFLDDDTELDDVDLVYLRGMTDEAVRHALALYLNHKGIAVINSESDRFQVITKLEQYVMLALGDVPVPDSFFAGRPQYYKKAHMFLGEKFPLVAKSIGGKNGSDNVLVATYEELDALAIPSPIFQPFLPNEFDYRVIVTGDRVALSYKRVRSTEENSHKNNVANGASREMTDLPDELKELAVRAAHVVGREFTGLDILTKRSRVILGRWLGNDCYVRVDIRQVLVERLLVLVM
jgi:glutathione synthase/RimK-type ligase-like ATP-grasp enzyme